MSLEVERVLWWSKASDWPNDGLGGTFLMRAVVQTGRALVTEWTDKDPTIPGSALLGPRIQTRTSTSENWKKAILRLASETSRQDVSAPSNEADCRSLKGVEPKLATANNARQRFRMACEMLANALQAGSVKSWSRAIEGGPLSPIDASCWNAEMTTLAPRFVQGKFHPGRPFELSYTGPGLRYIYVSSVELSAFLGKPLGERTSLLAEEATDPNERSAFLSTEPLEAAPSASEAAKVEKASPPTAGRKKPYRQMQVAPYLSKLYPSGVPGRESLADGDLVRAVQNAVDGDRKAKLQNALDAVPSRETILRSAGRL